MTRALLEQALNALEGVLDAPVGAATQFWSCSGGVYEAVKCNNAINAIQAELAKQAPYDQTALELCDKCGWKTLIPGEGCLNCQRSTQPALQGTDVDCAQHLKDGGADLASKLLPCPFCGETPEMYYQMDDLDDWKVLCHCGACTCPDEIRRTEKRAMEDWNTRTAPAWHDAPNAPGLWMNSISGRVNVVIEATLHAWQDTGARWFGPLPEDTK